MSTSQHILVVDDNKEILDLVSRFLSKDGYRVSTAGDGREMKKVMSDGRIDLILLDLMLPGDDGLTLCRDIRAESNIPIIMLTAKGEEIDRVIGLEMGADDYVPKPFGTRELLARIKAVLRRYNDVGNSVTSHADTPSIYLFDEWKLDTSKRELISNEEVVIPLSTGEFTLLMALVERPQRVLNRDQLLDIARGRASVAFDRSIDTQVSRLRRKIEKEPKQPELIKTVWGGGYVFTPEVTKE
ncbi:response regulator [Terasakiella pusilla]|uniref:response regulator n=1 Tax=Terasakiella pusilla TaxID=64973 RepID=UPI003AA8C4BE